jgi:hypothetical protein
MIRTLRALFLRCLLREKLLLMVFALMGVLMWLSSFSTRVGRFWREQRATTSMLSQQNQLLAERDTIEAAAQKAAAQLDATKTLNGNRLVAAVQQLANDAGLKNFQSRGAPTTKTIGKFSIHTLDVQIGRIAGTDWTALNNFYLALGARSPYIGIAKFALNANGPQHTLALTVSSIEIAH